MLQQACVAVNGMESGSSHGLATRSANISLAFAVVLDMQGTLHPNVGKTR